MSFAGKLARGLLSGAAGYYGKVAENEEYDRRAQALADREMALKRFDSSLRMGEADAASTRNIAEYGEKKKLDTQAELEVLPAKTEAADRLARSKAGYDAAADATKIRTQLQADLIKGQAEHGFKMDEQTAKATLDLAAQREKELGKVVGSTTDDNGDLNIIFASGQRMRVPGGKPIKNAPVDILGLGGDEPAPQQPTARPRRGLDPAGALTPADPQPKPAARYSQADLRDAIAKLGTVYANATPETYPGFFDAQGNKLPLAVLKQRLQEKAAQ